MGAGRIIILAIMAGVYSGILDGIEAETGMNSIGSALILVLVTFLTGYLLFKFKRKDVSTKH
ncbi:hypothetical protein D3H55_19475 [Bacillus salacetis]|uniref:Uncharacterized protein n=1 Tax=Bacillus salacetis TaxID=2315464 RepID=A0A3A1QUU9_9BACI|nr:hypothetical protein [Bacillus salacetis]RIW29177.1 hypothetical protein D3H55_19475 [Bacillus salacetis]